MAAPAAAPAAPTAHLLFRHTTRGARCPQSVVLVQRAQGESGAACRSERRACVRAAMLKRVRCAAACALCR